MNSIFLNFSETNGHCCCRHSLLRLEVFSSWTNWYVVPTFVHLSFLNFLGKTRPRFTQLLYAQTSVTMVLKDQFSRNTVQVSVTMVH